MVKLHFEKVYSNIRENEHCYTAIPYAKGVLWDTRGVCVVDCVGNAVPTQTKVTSRWNDGSVRWILIRYMVTLPANDSADYYVKTDVKEIAKGNIRTDGDIISTDKIKIKLSKNKNELFAGIAYGESRLGSTVITGPILVDGDGKRFEFEIEKWTVSETGSVCHIVKGNGWHIYNGERVYKIEITIKCFSDKSWIEVGYRVINTTNKPLKIKSLELQYKGDSEERAKSTVAHSNYKTKYIVSEDGRKIETVIDAELLKYEANEHNPEVYYGTLFGDRTGEDYGICATVYQAQQNYPKAISADKSGMRIKLVPEGIGNVIMQSGMAREQRVLLHLHPSEMPMSEINNRSIIYQMPDKAMIDTEVYRNAGVFEDVFIEDKQMDMELFLESKADEHSRCYGMMNWGDAPDMGYTSQGRGNGRLVWTNNEYDFPHACTLMFVRTANRKYLDYMLVAAKHWIDVDICHYSENPLLLGGQWEHTHGHCIDGEIVCSHQWVEGLLDYYHFTGDEEAYKSAIGIGENLLRLLDTPVFKQTGAMNARETGWAMRTLAALYKETNDEKWLVKCDWIVSHFEDWEKEYGHWLSPYTDNTAIRVVFMIAIAVGSLMRYYRINPREDVKDMILRAVDDLMDNARLENGLFYYKELPSLKRLGNNPIILEALTIAYELTGDTQYLKAGLPTLKYLRKLNMMQVSTRGKEEIEDTVMTRSAGTKSFAQMMLPVTVFYRACREESLI